MPTDIYNEEFQNWVKGVLALNTTRKALKTTVETKWSDFMSELPQTEMSQMKTFIGCLNQNEIQYFRSWKKEKTITWQCDHKVCTTLLERFIGLHRSTPKLEIKYERKVEDTKSESDRCPPENKPDNKELLDTDGMADESTDLVNANSQGGESQYFVWPIAKLYMFGEKSGGTYKSIDDLDISKIIKLMRSCVLFTFDGSEPYYDKIITARNELVHSTNNHMSVKRITHVLKEVRGLLEELSKTNIVADAAFCKEASQYLKQLEDRKFSVKHKSSEYRNMVKKIFDVETAVLELDTSIEESNFENKGKSKLLIDLLNKVTTGMDRTDLGEENKVIGYEPSEFKNIARSVIESKRSAIESDISECEDTGESYCYLERLKEETNLQLEDVEQLIKEPEPDEVLELISGLNKEVTTIRSECKQIESEIHKCDKELDELKKENIVLQERVKNPGVSGNLTPSHQHDILVTGQPRISLDKISMETDGYLTSGRYEASLAMEEIFAKYTLPGLAKNKANKGRRRKRKKHITRKTPIIFYAF